MEITCAPVAAVWVAFDVSAVVVVFTSDLALALAVLSLCVVVNEAAADEAAVDEAAVNECEEEEEALCAAPESAADLATASKGASGMATPGGPTLIPRSRTSPFSMSYTQPWMKTFAAGLASPERRRIELVVALPPEASRAKCCSMITSRNICYFRLRNECGRDTHVCNDTVLCDASDSGLDVLFHESTEASCNTI